MDKSVNLQNRKSNKNILLYQEQMSGHKVYG